MSLNAIKPTRFTADVSDIAVGLSSRIASLYSEQEQQALINEAKRINAANDSTKTWEGVLTQGIKTPLQHAETSPIQR